MNAVLTVQNRHVASCGTPPQLTTAPNRRVGYFENEHGEQFVLTYDTRTEQAKLWAGDWGWENPVDVELLDGSVYATFQNGDQTLLSGSEAAWIAAVLGAYASGGGE